MAGEKITGVTTMFMDEGLDTGDIIMQRTVDIADDMDHGQLQAILAQKGAALLQETLDGLEAGNVSRSKQDDGLATYAAMIKPEDEIIDWQHSAEDILNQIRALSPKPGAYTTHRGTRFKIFAAQIDDANKTGMPGRIAEINKTGFIVETGCGTLRINEVQKEGKSRMSSSDFLKGAPLLMGDILGG